MKGKELMLPHTYLEFAAWAAIMNVSTMFFQFNNFEPDTFFKKII